MDLKPLLSMSSPKTLTPYPSRMHPPNRVVEAPPPKVMNPVKWDMPSINQSGDYQSLARLQWLLNQLFPRMEP